MFSMQSVSKKSLVATFQLSSSASLNLGWSRKGVLGKMIRNTLQNPSSKPLAFQNKHNSVTFLFEKKVNYVVVTLKGPKKELWSILGSNSQS